MSSTVNNNTTKVVVKSDVERVVSAADEKSYDQPGNVVESVQVTKKNAAPASLGKSSHQYAFCIICTSTRTVPIEVGESRVEPNGLSLLHFCNLIRIVVPPKSKTLFEASYTPLCTECKEYVGKIQKLLQQIERLRQEFAQSCTKVKQQIISSTTRLANETWIQNDQEGINQVNGSISGIYGAMTFIHNRLTNYTSLHSDVPRKKPGRKPGVKLGKGILSLSAFNRATNQRNCSEIDLLSSHRSSFGRVVKRPRHLMSDGTGTDPEALKKLYFRHSPNLALESEKALYRKNLNVKTEAIPSTSSASLLVTRYGTDLRKNEANRTTANISKKGKPLPTRLHMVNIIGANGENLGSTIVKEEMSCIDKSEFKHDERKCFIGKTPNASSKKSNVLKIKCYKCGQIFPNMRTRDEHMKQTHDGNAYECQLCSKKFSRLRELLKHRKMEHSLRRPKGGLKTFECEFCKLSFRNIGDVRIHERKHTGERPFRCDICNEAFISKMHYEVHVERKHPTIPPLQCEFCPRKFFRHHRLRDHRTNHTGEKLYQCELCGKSFSQPAYLKYHQTKHKELNLEEFKCDQCDKKFASPINLKFHTETQHQKKYRFHCSICNHGASHASHLKLHMRSHTGERPFVCEICSKTFSRNSQLKIHVRSHTGERPYTCSTCTKGFTNSSKLRRHELTHQVNRTRRPKEIIQVTPLVEEVEVEDIADDNQEHTDILATATAAVLLPEIHEENGQQYVKLEHLQSQLTDENQQQLITLEQPNGMAYQVISANGMLHADQFAEFIVLNGDFTIS